MTADLTCGIDIGGTKIAGAVVDGDGAVLEEARVESPATDPSAIEAAVAGLVAGLAARHPVTAVGVGAAGYIDADRSTVLFAPNIAWRDEPLGRDLSRLTGLPVTIENDANAAAWGEFRYGAGRDVEDQLMVTVGTGVGGGVIAGGRLLPRRRTASPGRSATSAWCRTADSAAVATGVASSSTDPVRRWCARPVRRRSAPRCWLVTCSTARVVTRLPSPAP